ncbi:hypothetical protein [Streptomyces sp. YIM 132580]|uniref:hypothetical protein n=1 Tax=Streptomyces sp. YIM 132580 TaxID=2691958 RepID=UPI00136E6F14|nr:hypothetical protein [Streptomyces sp. YIM 132580]
MAAAGDRRPAPAKLGQENYFTGTPESNAVAVEAAQNPPTPTEAPSGPPASPTTTDPTPQPPEPEQSSSPSVRPEPWGAGHGGATKKSAPSAGPAEEEAEDEEICFVHPDRDAVRTTLHGLPDEIVAGSGWHNFTFRVANTSDRSMKSVIAYVMKDIYTPSEDFKNLEYLLTLEWYDQDTGTWEVAEPGYGHTFDLPALEPGEHIDFTLRIKVHARPSSGVGAVIVAAEYRDENGLCGRTGGDDDTGSTVYDFAIVDENSQPPATNPPAKGKEPATASPSPAQRDIRKDTGIEARAAGQSGKTETPHSQAVSSGSLAQTGGGAAKWVLGAGCISIALGSGIAFAAKRRRSQGPT